MKQKKSKGGKGKPFWNKEYKKGKTRTGTKKRSPGPGVNRPGGHLLLSTKPSDNLLKFTRFLERRATPGTLQPGNSALDLGCGNGRHLIYLAREFGMSGFGIDISDEAINDAKSLGGDLPLVYRKQSLTEPLPIDDASQTIVLDMMTSHVLQHDARARLLAEIHRVLIPGGWFLFKTFLREGDLHAGRMLRNNPGSEKGSYIHPKIGVEEHVFTLKEIDGLFEGIFTIHKKIKSYRHIRAGRAFKRRSICIYAEKLPSLDVH